jgi:hypothetical protein
VGVGGAMLFLSGPLVYELYDTKYWITFDWQAGGGWGWMERKFSHGHQGVGDRVEGGRCTHLTGF